MAILDSPDPLLSSVDIAVFAVPVDDDIAGIRGQRNSC